MRVVVFGINFMFSVMCAILSPSVSYSHMGSIFSTERRLFSVCIIRSTRPVPLRSPTGARISLILLSLQNISKFRSKLMVHGIPWNIM